MGIFDWFVIKRKLLLNLNNLILWITFRRKKERERIKKKMKDEEKKRKKIKNKLKKESQKGPWSTDGFERRQKNFENQINKKLNSKIWNIEKYCTRYNFPIILSRKEKSLVESNGKMGIYPPKFYGDHKSIFKPYSGISYTEYYKNGKLNEVKSWSEGELDGICRKYDKKGKLILEEKWEDGNMISEKRWDKDGNEIEK